MQLIFKNCKDLGFNVYYQTTIGDNHDRFKECLDVAFKRGASNYDWGIRTYPR